MLSISIIPARSLSNLNTSHEVVRSHRNNSPNVFFDVKKCQRSLPNPRGDPFGNKLNMSCCCTVVRIPTSMTGNTPNMRFASCSAALVTGHPSAFVAVMSMRRIWRLAPVFSGFCRTWCKSHENDNNIVVSPTWASSKKVPVMSLMIRACNVRCNRGSRVTSTTWPCQKHRLTFLMIFLARGGKYHVFMEILEVPKMFQNVLEYVREP